MTRTTRAMNLAATTLVALASGCASKVACTVPAQMDAPTHAVYVAVCGDDQNDGTFARPFRTIPRALASGSTYVAVGDGEFEEPVAPVDRTVTIRGAGAERSRIRSASASGPVPRAVVEATAHGSLALVDLGVTGRARSGVLVSGGALSLTRVKVAGIDDPSAAPLAHGVVAVDAALHADAVDIRANAGWGVVSTRSSVELKASVVERNAGGGIAVVGVPSGGGGAFLEGGTISENVEVGVAAFGAQLRVVGTRVMRTVARGAAGGDGILAVSLIGESGAEAASRIDIADARVTENARAGVLLDGGARGTLSGGLVGENGRAGLWVQRGAAAPFAVTGVAFEGNVGSGVVVTSGAALSFASSTVTGTRSLGVIDGLDSVTIGDGFSVFDAASATVTGSTFGPSARVAVLTDGASATTTFTGNHVTMGGDAVVIQGGVGVSFDAASNTLSSGARVVDAGTSRALATVRGVVAVTRAP